MVYRTIDLIYALGSSISTVTFSKAGSVTLFCGLFGGDLLFDLVDTADALPLLPRLPRRDPVRDPGDRDFFFLLKYHVLSCDSTKSQNSF